MKTSSKPSSANPEDGRRNVHGSLRSIVMSPASFTLFRGFNPTSTSTTAAAGNLEIAGLPFPPYPDFIKNTSTDLNGLLKSCFDEAEAHAQVRGQLLQETAITALLAKKFNDAFGNNEGERCITAKNEERLVWGTGIVDLIFSKEMEESTTNSKATKKKMAVGLVEVGLLRQDESEACQLEYRFWEKAGQASKYLRLLRKDSNWKWEEALLLGILVATRDCNKGRLAVFVCEPKGKDGWRMALLWRAELESRIELSEAFGYYMNGLVYLSKEGAKLTRNGDIVWEYLGPNCTKVAVKDTTEKV